MKWKPGEKEKLKQIIKQVSGTLEAEDGPLIESVKVKGKGNLWCYAPLLNRMVRVVRGTRVYIISEMKNNEGKVLVYTANVDVVYIHKNELLEVGFN